MDLIWNKYTNGNWCDFWNVNLNDSHFNELDGVYIIFSFMPNGSVHAFRLGQGRIKDRLLAHREEFRRSYGNTPLLVTWSRVDMRQVDGVEAYLFDLLVPEIGERRPTNDYEGVNLPDLNWV